MKYVQGNFGFFVNDEDADYVDQIIGHMWVQIDENVVEYDKDGNEKSIDTSGITIGHSVLPTKDVYICSWVYFNESDTEPSGIEPGGGGWEWSLDHDEVRTYFDGEAARWAGTIARVRFLRMQVPDYGEDEAGRLRITEWLNERTDDVEYKIEPLESRLVYPDEDGRRAILTDLVELKGRGIDCSADESAEIKSFLRDYPDDPLTERLAYAFPLERDEVGELDLEDIIGTRRSFEAAKDLIGDPALLIDVDHEYVRACVEMVAWEVGHPIEDTKRVVARMLQVPYDWMTAGIVHYPGADGNAACGMEAVVTDGDSDNVTCEKCKPLVDRPLIDLDDPDFYELARFLEQNTLCAATMTDDQKLAAAGFAHHHAGGLYVLLIALGGDTWYSKCHDSWGDDGKVVVHIYNAEDPENDGEEEHYFDTGREAVEFFLNYEKEF